MKRAMKETKFPVGKRFDMNGVEFYIESNCGMGKGGNYSVYCITDHRNLVTRAKFETCISKIKERCV